MEAKGWWRIAIANRVLRRLETVREELNEHEGKRLSYSATIDFLIQRYRSEKAVMAEKCNN